MVITHDEGQQYKKFMLILFKLTIKLAAIYLFKANNRNTRAMCEVCSK